jgi:hypothetical protein
MYIEAVPNRNSPSAILLRESYRQDGKVRKRTLCNLSDWSPAHIEGRRGVLKIGLDHLLGPDGNRCRDLVLALLIGRILDPVSKLAAARTLSPATASSSLGEALGLGAVTDDELYAALDWLLARQPAIETALANAIARTAPWCSTTSRRATCPGANIRVIRRKVAVTGSEPSWYGGV